MVLIFLLKLLIQPLKSILLSPTEKGTVAMRTGMLLLLCLLNGSFVSAKVYKWVDEKGVTHYSQNKPEGKETTQIKVKGMPDSDEKELTNNDAIPVEVNCQQAVRHNTKLMVAEFKLESGNNSLVDALTDPILIIDNIAECNREIKDPAKAAVWFCQQNSTTVDEIELCEKLLGGAD